MGPYYHSDSRVKKAMNGLLHNLLSLTTKCSSESYPGHGGIIFVALLIFRCVSSAKQLSVGEKKKSNR